jgi:hypothetical protein
MENLLCGIQLIWIYDNQMVDILMPGYIKKKIQEHGHFIHKRAQTCPYSPKPKQFGSEAQAPLLPDTPPKLDMKSIKHVQQII